jgi:hypothetical protein
MKKNFFTLMTILAYNFVQSQAIDKGDKFFGLQTNLASTDLYYTYLDLSLSKNEKRVGFHLAPTWQWAVENNFVVGTAAHVGFNSEKSNFNFSFPSNEYKFEALDLGVNAFSRYYIDVIRNKKLKLFGLAGIHVAYSSWKSNYTNIGWPNNSSSTNETFVRGSIGFGAAYASKKGMIELNISNAGFFLGIHKKLKGRSGK